MQMKQVEIQFGELCRGWHQCIAVHTFSEILVRNGACSEKHVLYAAFFQALPNVSLSQDQRCCLLAQLQPDHTGAAALLRDLHSETAAAADTCVISLYCATSRRGLE